MSSSARIDELRKKFDENPRRYFAPLANEYRKAGDFEQAVFICQEYLPQQPGHMSGHIVYGQTLFDMGRDEEARAVFETALTLDPENLIALKHLGDIARQAGDVEGARSWYHRVLEADPRNDEIMQVLESIAGGEQSLAAGAATAPEAQSVPDYASPVSFSDLTSLGFESPADETDDLTDVPPLPADQAAEESEPVEALILEQSVDAELPVAEPESSMVTAAADESVEPTEELLDLDDFSLGPAVTSSESAPEPESVAAADAIEIDEFAAEFADEETTVDEIGAEPTVESAAREQERTGEPDVELATDMILGLPDDLPAESPGAEVAGLEVEATPVASENLTRAIDQLEGLETFSIDVPPPLPVEEPAAESTDQPVEAATPDTFATETMADLYAQQGHFESAMEIYEQLLERSPDDAELRRRATEVERQMSGGYAAVPETNESEVVAAADEAIEAQAVPETTSSVFAGPTIRDFFNEILQAAAGDAPAEDLEPIGASSSSQSEGSLDILFSDSATDDADHSAAMSLAQAFGTEEQIDENPALQGTPAHPASDELSLDHVFRAATPAKGSAAAGAFSLDQFFAGEMSNSEMPDASGEGTAGDGGSAHHASDDIAQFNAWLNGLKKT